MVTSGHCFSSNWEASANRHVAFRIRTMEEEPIMKITLQETCSGRAGELCRRAHRDICSPAMSAQLQSVEGGEVLVQGTVIVQPLNHGQERLMRG